MDVARRPGGRLRRAGALRQRGTGVRSRPEGLLRPLGGVLAAGGVVGEAGDLGHPVIDVLLAVQGDRRGYFLVPADTRLGREVVGAGRTTRHQSRELQGEETAVRQAITVLAVRRGVAVDAVEALIDLGQA